MLLVAGSFTLLGTMQPVPVVILSAVGLLLGDLFTFWAGHHWGARWVRRPWAASFVAPERLPAIEERAGRYALPFSFVTRFLPGQRATLFFLAGTFRMPYRGFLVGDGIGALVQAGLFVYGARSLGWSWAMLRGRFERADDVLTAALVLGAFVLLWRRRAP
nr:DedA family protein [Ramlibacter cellulosilyticus]